MFLCFWGVLTGLDYRLLCSKRLDVRMRVLLVVPVIGVLVLPVEARARGGGGWCRGPPSSWCACATGGLCDSRTITVLLFFSFF